MTPLRHLTREQWRKVDALLERVLDAAPEARPGLVESLSGGDENVRRAAEAVLSAAERPDPLLAPGELSLEEGPFADVERDALGAGDLVGAWRIVREIGRGGVGTVYLAERDDGQYAHRAALKVLRRGLDTDDVLARFRLERQLLASLSHPNIATLLDGGATAGGRPFLVMEAVEGKPINDYCTEHRLATRERLELFLQVCDAVAHAHRRLVVHRDLKPANILVTEEDPCRPGMAGLRDNDRPDVPARHVKLLDFGIAKLLDSAAVPGESPPTRAGMRLMTPDYATPEQVRGEPVSTATDIYQLGIVLYELLTGRHPQPVVGSAALERVVCEQEPVPPSRAVFDGPVPDSVRSRELRGDLDGVVHKAMRKRPDDRYASAAELAGDIRRWLEGRPVRARPIGRLQRLGKLIARRPVAAGAVLAGTLAVTAFTITLWIYSGMVETERDRARLEAARAEAALWETETALARAESLREFLLDLFRAAQPDRPHAQLPGTEEILALGARRAMDAGAAGPVERIGMLSTIADVYLQHHRIGEARPLLDEAESLARGARRSDELARLLISQAEIAAFTHDLDAAELKLEEAESLIRQQDLPWEALANTRVVRATLERFRGNHPRMLELLEPLHADLLERDDVDPSARILVVETLSAAYAANGMLDRALGLGLQEVELKRQSAGTESHAYANGLLNAAWYEELLGRFESAEVRVRAAIEIQNAIFDRANMHQALAYRQLAGVLLHSGRFDEALEYTVREVRERVAADGADADLEERLQLARGIRLAEMQRWPEAERALSGAQRWFTEPGISPRGLYAPLELLLARTLCNRGKAGHGEAILDELAARSGGRAPADPAYNAHISEARAACALQAGDPSAALEAIDRALDYRDPPGRAMQRAAREVIKARILAALARPAEAAAALDRAERQFFDLGLNDHPHLARIDVTRGELQLFEGKPESE